ncbi:hypothetical protein [Chitinophaga polysaccharea]|uniref:hypothetical protein n=1 Tax=Chitinophaga polysaccharea TaxID=1293035 RepID=UPI00115C1CA2|nr:hypothetical protein [Chitinophaga polysaccharea]
MKFKYIFVLLGILLANVVGAQNAIKPATPDFSKLSIPENRAVYKVTVEAEKTPYRVFINDIPLMSTSISGSLSFFANSAILNSGVQRIRIDYKSEAKAGSSLKAIVAETAWQKGGGLKEPKELWRFEGKGANSGTFYADVPHKITGWQQSTVVNKDDRVRMTKAQSWFMQMAEYLKAGNGNAFMGMLSGAEMLVFKTNYLSEAEAIQQYNGWKNYINKGGIKLGGLKSSYVEIVGDGKLLHLVKPSGEGALAIIQGTRKTVVDIFVHFPNGQNEPEAVMVNMVEY